VRIIKLDNLLVTVSLSTTDIGSDSVKPDFWPRCPAFSCFGIRNKFSIVQISLIQHESVISRVLKIVKSIICIFVLFLVWEAAASTVNIKF